MRKAITKEETALLKEAGEMFNETGYVPGIDGEQVPQSRPRPFPLCGLPVNFRMCSVGDRALPGRERPVGFSPLEQINGHL